MTNKKERSHGRPKAGSPANVLRACLSSEWPEFRELAERKIAEAFGGAETLGAAGAALGLPRRTFDDLRRDFPQLDGRGKRR